MYAFQHINDPDNFLRISDGQRDWSWEVGVDKASQFETQNDALLALQQAARNSHSVTFCAQLVKVTPKPVQPVKVEYAVEVL